MIVLRIRLFSIAVVLLAFTIPGRPLLAQGNAEWQEIAPHGESFHILMPTESVIYPITIGSVSGTRYKSAAEGSNYMVWSLRTSTVNSFQKVDEYLDDAGDLVWQKLLEPARESLSDADRKLAQMTYEKELSAKTLPGREYSFVIGDKKGAAQIYVAAEQVFILMVVDSPSSPWHRTRFFESFVVSPELPKLTPAPEAPSSSTKTEDADERVFKGREVTKKPRVLSKPEPSYTESARQYSVQGTVVLRAVFSKTGDVTNISVISKLPHGLTRRAIESARAIKFTPAELDGRPVSMWMELQYNFNLY